MIVLLRKKILVLAALLLFGVLLLCGTFVRGALPVFRPSGVPERSVIVIDAGHGGEDGGAVREAGRLFWWMLKSTAFGVSFTSATRFLRSEAFFSRSVLAPSE